MLNSWVFVAWGFCPWVFSPRPEAGVGVLLKRELAESVLGCWQISKRLMVVKIDAKSVGLNIIQVYTPTTNYSDSEMDEFYEELDQVRRQCRAGEVTVVMMDLNAKVGRRPEGV